VALEPLSGN